MCGTRRKYVQAAAQTKLPLRPEAEDTDGSSAILSRPGSVASSGSGGQIPKLLALEPAAKRARIGEDDDDDDDDEDSLPISRTRRIDHRPRRSSALRKIAYTEDFDKPAEDGE
jgi:hypothetical protein